MNAGTTSLVDCDRIAFVFRTCGADGCTSKRSSLGGVLETKDQGNRGCKSDYRQTDSHRKFSPCLIIASQPQHAIVDVVAYKGGPNERMCRLSRLVSLRHNARALAWIVFVRSGVNLTRRGFTQDLQERTSYAFVLGKRLSVNGMAR